MIRHSCCLDGIVLRMVVELVERSEDAIERVVVSYAMRLNSELYIPGIQFGGKDRSIQGRCVVGNKGTGIF
jgi:hypothetical protein